MFLETDVTDSGGLIYTVVRQGQTFTRALSTHTLATVTTVVLKEGTS